MFLLGTFGTVLGVGLAGIALKMSDAAIQGSQDAVRLVNLYNVLFGVESLRQAVNRILAGSAPDAVQRTVDARIPFIMMMAANLLLMSLTAGRIWYTRRAAEIVGCGSFRKRYNVAMAMIHQNLIYTGAAGGFLIQTMSISQNIAPTLILVRVGLAHCRWKADPIHGGAMSQPISSVSSLPRALK
ncbi:hypothetical protein B0H13DRAFT_1877439 [Mycena leptocephala]|nr:hypothetical protein B0H13DRAFT_1877439 [Mycena leptocephala]